MERKLFYDALRESTLFGGVKKGLTQDQVVGMEALLNSFEKWGIADPWHAANILAQVHHETGGQMMPVKETVYASSKVRDPSDATVIARLNAAFAKGQLPWVKTPYWKDGWFGRGMIQLTHEKNYAKLGPPIGVDLVKDRDAALHKDVAADIAVVGMSRGLFTGKKLSDYDFPASLSSGADYNPRRIVNGEDGTDKDIAAATKVFYNALVKAGYDAKPADPTQPAPAPAVPPPTPVRTKSVIVAEIRALLDELELLGG